MTANNVNAVERFYDFHPINAKQILDSAPGRQSRSTGLGQLQMLKTVRFGCASPARRPENG